MPTAQDYDAVPYEDCPLIQTNPDYLSVIAQLFGVESASPARANILELGCASGGNIIPMAYYWPESNFVGVELSEKQALQASELVQKLGLRNIKIIQGDILELDESLGSFDFIITHGVYSWVPAKVQDYILKLVEKILAPNGVAFISYNTFPGWHSRLAVRDMMLHHGRETRTPEQKLAKGMELLKLLADGLPESSSLSEQWLKREVQTLLTLTPSYLLHDYLEENNRPIYFHQFMEKAAGSNLQYLAEADLYTMLGSTLTRQAQQSLDDIDNLIEYEQYLDFYYVRYFRQTLLCHEAQDVNRDLDIEKIKAYFFFALLNTSDEIDLNSTATQVFRHPNGTAFDISHPLTKAALIELAYHYPNSFAYDELLQRAKSLLEHNESDYANADPDDMLSELFNLFMSQGVGLTRVQRQFEMSSSKQPKVSLLARVYAEQERCCVASVHHGNISLDEIDRYLLTLMDGTRSLDVLVNAIRKRIASDNTLRGQIEVKTKDEDVLLQQLKSRIEQSIYFFAVNGLLE